MRYHWRMHIAAGFAAERSASLARLIAEDTAGQLRRRDGTMAAPGSEAGVAKLDWVDGVPLQVAPQGAARLSEGAVPLYRPAGRAEVDGPVAALAGAIRSLYDRASPLAYLDLTANGDWPTELTRICERFVAIGAGIGLPTKLRRAPGAYHATEQSEMDGPAALVSLRLLRSQAERCLLGEYDDRFLRAQAAGTWQAMGETGRACFLLVLDGDVQVAATGLGRFFEGLAARTSG